MALFALAKKCARFSEQKDFTDTWWIFMKGILAKGVRDILGDKCPSYVDA